MKKMKIKKTKREEILYYKEGDNYKKFMEVYASSPFEARIFAHSGACSIEDTTLYEENPEKFQIVTRTRQFSVGKNNRIYYRTNQRRVFFVNNGKFHSIDDDKRRHLASATIFSIEQGVEKEFLIKRFSWMRFLDEYKIPILFNSVVKYKLYDLKKVLFHLYKVPYPKSLALHNRIHQAKGTHFVHHWRKSMSKVFTGLENLNMDLLEDPGFLQDAAHMAERVNAKINLSWSKRRLIEEHDNWSRVISNVLGKIANHTLKIAPVFEEFAKLITPEDGFLIRESKDLVHEGMTQSHCVATYDFQVDRGSCAIYHYKGYTLEILKGYKGQAIAFGQFKGFRNSKPPDELIREVLNLVNNFNTGFNPEGKIHNRREG